MAEQKASGANPGDARLVPEEGRVATVLAVDDEPNILSALRRTLRGTELRLLTAESGREGLALLEKEDVDLVLSDMRMPEMDGAQFLEQVATRWPLTVRILLTGYSDLTSTVAAVNRGRIYSYLSKPWSDDELRLIIQRALERRQLERRERMLTRLVHQRNKELAALNANLEEKVQERTQTLCLTAERLEIAHCDLQANFEASIQILAHLISLREGGNARGHGARVAANARGVAERMGLDEAACREVYHAGLLHDIGKLGFPDALNGRPFDSLSPEDRVQVKLHPGMGRAALMALESLAGAAELIYAHHERFDGLGYPNGLVGESIPLGARILVVANEFDNLLCGTLTGSSFTPEKARAFLADNRRTRYDPEVVDAFLALLSSGEADGGGAFVVAGPAELQLTPADLREGMILSQDLLNHHDLLLLPAGRTLSGAIIQRIRALEKEERQGYVVHVRYPEASD